MSTKPGGVESDSNTDISANASRFEYGVAHTSETLTDAIKFQGQDLVGKLTGVERNGCVSARDDKDVDSHGDNLCNMVDSDSRDSGVVLAGSDLLKSKDESLKLSDSDMVWAKVRSYPWWPGQVFDASVASKIAKKHYKKGNVLVAFFGDSTFARNSASQIKPFHQYFSQMQEQSNSAEYCDAIDYALEEVSRRVEFGLSCTCVSEEAYNKLKTQNIINTGIREDSGVRYGGDKLSNAISFEPAKLVEYLRHLACYPDYDATEKLQFVINRAQVLAFQQWINYSHFLDYETFVRSVEPLASLPKSNKVDGVSSKKRKTDYKDIAEHKERFDFEDRTDEKTNEKTLPDLIVNKRCWSRSTEKLDGKSHSGKKRNVESLESGKSEKKIKHNRQKEDSVSKNSDEENNFAVCDANELQMAAEPCYGIRGESEINSSTPTLKPCNNSNSTTKEEVKNEKTKKPKHEELAERKISSLGLHAAAKTPIGIPESISIDPLNYEDFESSLMNYLAVISMMTLRRQVSLRHQKLIIRKTLQKIRSYLQIKKSLAQAQKSKLVSRTVLQIHQHPMR